MLIGPEDSSPCIQSCMIILDGIKIDLNSSHRSKLSVLKAIPEACSHLLKSSGPHSIFLFFILCQLANISASLASWIWAFLVTAETSSIMPSFALLFLERKMFLHKGQKRLPASPFTLSANFNAPPSMRKPPMASFSLLAIRGCAWPGGSCNWTPNSGTWSLKMERRMDFSNAERWPSNLETREDLKQHSVSQLSSCCKFCCISLMPTKTHHSFLVGTCASTFPGVTSSL